MKLNELTTITSRNLAPKRRSNILDPDKINKKFHPKDTNNMEIHSGGFAKTYIHNDHPNIATRITRKVQNVQNDAYFKYLSAIAKSDRIQRNPYFPKIYSVRVAADKKDDQMYSIEMERLLNFDTLSAEECIMLGERLFFNFTGFVKQFIARRKELVPQSLRDKVTIKSQATAGFILLKTLEKCCMYSNCSWHSDVATFIKDPKLKEAMIILRDLIKKDFEVTPDFHGGNVMVRRGPFGPQLVLTDPIA